MVIRSDVVSAALDEMPEGQLPTLPERERRHPRAIPGDRVRNGRAHFVGIPGAELIAGDICERVRR